MTIDKIKDIVNENKNKLINFKYNGSRNQTEEFKGKIDNVYKAIFTIKINDDITKSFSYADVLIGDLEIKL